MAEMTRTDELNRRIELQHQLIKQGIEDSMGDKFIAERLKRIQQFTDEKIRLNIREAA